MKNLHYGLNDILGPITVGPSSSHFTAVVKCGRFVYYYYGGVPPSVKITLFNSMSLTGLGHRTHYAVLGGLMGVSYDNPKINTAWKDLLERIGEDNVKIHHEMDEADKNEPYAEFNANKIIIELPESNDIFVFYSTGGGNVILASINGNHAGFQFNGWFLFLKCSNCEKDKITKIAQLSNLKCCPGNVGKVTVFEGQGEKSKLKLLSLIEKYLPIKREFFITHKI